MDNLIIRKAVREDAEEISGIIKTAMEFYIKNSNIPGTLKSLTESIADIEKYICEDEFIVSIFHNTLSGTVRISELNKDSYQISRFSVLPAMHKLGVGSLLFASAEDYLRKVNAHECILFTALTNMQMVKFYTARGYELVETKYERGYPRGKFYKKYN